MTTMTTTMAELTGFINNIFIHDSSDHEKMTLSDAVYNMCNWLADGVEIPEGITPEMVMMAWNRAIDAANMDAGIFSDDSDEI